MIRDSIAALLGRAPIVDFDGTIADLGVDWKSLREDLGVNSMTEVWSMAPQTWNEVRRREVEAAHHRARPNLELEVALLDVEQLAILTANAEDAVHAYLDARHTLRRRVAVVVGRETLGGPKSEWGIFRGGFHRCLEATSDARGIGRAVYVGDQAYELEFARQMGAQAIDVADLARGGQL